jgi:hypothetical protein
MNIEQAVDLLTHNLGARSLPHKLTEQDLDWNPPPAILAALADRTGVETSHLRSMTIAGWVPWLLDTLHDVGQEGFDTYVCQDSVLFSSRLIGAYRVLAWRPWMPSRPSARRMCPCAPAGQSGSSL